MMSNQPSATLPTLLLEPNQLQNHLNDVGQKLTVNGDFKVDKYKDIIEEYEESREEVDPANCSEKLRVLYVKDKAAKKPKGYKQRNWWRTAIWHSRWLELIKKETARPFEEKGIDDYLQKEHDCKRNFDPHTLHTRLKLLPEILKNRFLSVESRNEILSWIGGNTLTWMNRQDMDVINEKIRQWFASEIESAEFAASEVEYNDNINSDGCTNASKKNQVKRKWNEMDSNNNNNTSNSNVARKQQPVLQSIQNNNNNESNGKKVINSSSNFTGKSSVVESAPGQNNVNHNNNHTQGLGFVRNLPLQNQLTKETLKPMQLGNTDLVNNHQTLVSQLSTQLTETRAINRQLENNLALERNNTQFFKENVEKLLNKW